MRYRILSPQFGPFSFLFYFYFVFTCSATSFPRLQFYREPVKKPCLLYFGRARFCSLQILFLFYNSFFRYRNYFFICIFTVFLFFNHFFRILITYILPSLLYFRLFLTVVPITRSKHSFSFLLLLILTKIILLFFVIPLLFLLIILKILQ